MPTQHPRTPRWLAPAWAALLLQLIACSSAPDTGQTATGGSTNTDAATSPEGSPDSGTSSDSPSEGGSGSGGAPNSEATVPTTPEGVCRAAIAAQCDRRIACLGGNPCPPVADLCPEYYFNANSNRTVDEMAACIETIRTMPCIDLAVSAYPSCFKDGRLPLGASCSNNTECMGEGCGRPNATACGTCGGSAALGEPCELSIQCHVGTFCHSQTKKCTANETIVHGSRGAPCDSHADPVLGCQGDLACVRNEAGTAGVCEPLPGDGQPCARFRNLLEGPDCAPGLICHTDNQCRPPQQCVGATCGADSYCRQTEPEACARLATEGEGCAMYGIPDDPRCEPSSECVYLEGSYVCRKRPANWIGQPCDSSHLCPTLFVCREGKCAALTTAECSAQ